MLAHYIKRWFETRWRDGGLEIVLNKGMSSTNIAKQGNVVNKPTENSMRGLDFDSILCLQAKAVGKFWKVGGHKVCPEKPDTASCRRRKPESGSGGPPPENFEKLVLSPRI